jgi:arylsulfatase A-like enzyme
VLDLILINLLNYNQSVMKAKIIALVSLLSLSFSCREMDEELSKSEETKTIKPSSQKKMAVSKPNIVFILVDDLAYFDKSVDANGNLGLTNTNVIPNIWGLGGVRFTNAMCPAPVCSPARTSILFSTSPNRSGVYKNADEWFNSNTLQASAMPKYFKDNGYKTYRYGKIFHSTDTKAGETWWNSFSITPSSVTTGQTITAQSAGNASFKGGYYTNEAGATDYKNTSYAIQTINGVANDQANGSTVPFMVFLGLSKPHVPSLSAQSDYNRFANLNRPPFVSDDTNDVFGGSTYSGFSGNSDPELVKFVRAFAGASYFTDRMAKRVFDVIKNNTTLRNNTIIVLLSDHGFHLGEKSHVTKSTLWQQSMRVPMVWWGPVANIQSGRTENRTISTLDVYATLAQLCGISANTNNTIGDGKSFASVLTAGANGTLPRSTVTTIYGPNNSAVVNGDDKYILYPNSTNTTGFEFYRWGGNGGDYYERTNGYTNSSYSSRITTLRGLLPSSYQSPVGGGN